MQAIPQFTYRKLTAALMLAGMSTTGMAQTEPSAIEPSATELETIMVFGQREAANRALGLYRDSDAVANYISADDMGQFVDQNVAESLQRLPGVTISRDQGEGRFVSVRGVSAGLSTVTINGMRIGTPESGSRAVPLDVIPTGSVDGIEVVKVPTPDMPGDAVGGSINVSSASAFDRDGRQITYRLDGSYNDLSGETSPKAQFNFSDVVDGFGGTDNIGISFGLNYLNRKLESDNIEPEYDFLDFNGDDVFTLLEVNERKYFVERERLGFNLNLEYQANANTRFYANTVYSEFTDAETRQRNVFVFEDATITAFDGANVRYADMPEDSFRRRIRFRTKEQDTLAFAVGAEHDFQAWSLDYNMGISTTDERVPDEQEGRFEKTGNALDANVQLGQGIPDYTFLENGVPAVGYLDNSLYELDRVVNEPIAVDDDDFNFALNMEVPMAFGIESLTVKTGIDGRFKDKIADVNEFEERDTPDVLLSQFTTGAPSYGLGDLGQGISSSAFVNFYNSNRSDFKARPRDADENRALSSVQDFSAEENVTAGYMMGTWDLDRIRVIAGARIERTDYSADGNELVFDENGDLGINARSVSSKYTNVLPGLHLRYEPTDNLVVRAAWSNTIARPSFSDISPRSQINREDMEIELGNPDLDPYKSTNFDFLADWYFGNSGIISAGVFYKDIDDYIVDMSTRQNPEFAGFEVEQPVNGTKASVTGIEFNVQQGLEVFNESLMGLLAGFNLTALDTDLEISERAGESFALPEAAERSGNFYVGYENELFSTRLSVTYRDKLLSEVGDSELFDLYVAPHTQVDLTASYRFNPRFELVAELTNLTDEALELYQGSKNYTFQFEEYGPTFAIGFKGQF